MNTNRVSRRKGYLHPVASFASVARTMLLLLLCLAGTARAQLGVVPMVGTFANVPAIITTGATSNVLDDITVYKGRGLSILPHFAGTNAGTANVTFRFEVSADGTNFTTTGPLQLIVAMNGATGVRGWTNWSAATLDNIRAVRLASIANAHTASIFPTNVTWAVAP